VLIGMLIATVQANAKGQRVGGVSAGARGKYGGGGIRTPETLSGLTVFKTAGFNRSPTPPFLILA
jgi:hypothetical protein